MKREFYSKYSKLRITLKPGIPGERITGRLPVPAEYVLFVNGKVIIDDKTEKEKFELIKRSTGFNTDFFLMEDEKDPNIKNIIENTKSSEPRHIIQEIKYGSVGKTEGDKAPVKFNDAQKAAIKEMMNDLTTDFKKETELLKEEISNLKKNEDVPRGTSEAEDKEAKVENTETDVKKKPGRPPKVNQ